MSFFKGRPTWLAPWARMSWWILSFLALYGFGHHAFNFSPTSAKLTGKITELPKDITFALICLLGLLVLLLANIFHPYDKKDLE
jgi:hypothetical protein